MEAAEAALRARVFEALAEALVRRFGAVLAVAESSGPLQLGPTAGRDLLASLSVGWPAEMRRYLLDHADDLVWGPRVTLTQQQQSQQQQQNSHQRQEQQRYAPGVTTEAVLARLALARLARESARARELLVEVLAGELFGMAPDLPVAPILPSPAPAERPPEPGRGAQVMQVPTPAPLSPERRAPASAPDIPPPADPADERVEFSAWGPDAVRVDQPFELDLWACTAAQFVRVRALARRMAQTEHGDRAAASVTPGAMLTVQLVCPALLIEEEMQCLCWSGTQVAASFSCMLPAAGADTPPRWRIGGRFIVAAAGVPIADVSFVLPVGAGGPEERRFHSARVSPPRSAFASYSSDDREEVLRCIQGMTAALPELEVFCDVDSLRSGEDWAARLSGEIHRREAFYLFWSTAAAQSEWVEREWRCALGGPRGLASIRPCPLQDPRLAPPPAELSALHFDSVYRVHVEAERAVRSQLASHRF